MAAWRCRRCRSPGRSGPTSSSHAIVAHGEEIARPELAHSVHVELTGLQPDRPYWYRFRAGGVEERDRARPDASRRSERARAACASASAAARITRTASTPPIATSPTRSSLSSTIMATISMKAGPGGIETSHSGEITVAGAPPSRPELPRPQRLSTALRPVQDRPRFAARPRRPDLVRHVRRP